MGEHGVFYAQFNHLEQVVPLAETLVQAGAQTLIYTNILKDGMQNGIDVEGTKLTIAAWFKADTFAVQDARLISKATGTSEAAEFKILKKLGQFFTIGGGNFKI